MPARRDDDGLRANGTGTLHIQRRIANDPDVSRIDRLADMPLCFVQGPSATNIVAISKAIREAAERKVIPKAEMPQLDLRPRREYCRSAVQRQRTFAHEPRRPQCPEAHSLAMRRASLADAVKYDFLSRSRFASVGSSHGSRAIPARFRIRSSAVWHTVANFSTPNPLEPSFHRRLACPAGTDQCPIDIKETARASCQYTRRLQS